MCVIMKGYKILKPDKFHQASTSGFLKLLLSRKPVYVSFPI